MGDRQSADRRTSLRRRLTDAEVARRLVHASGSGLPALYLLGIASWEHVGLLFAIGALVAVGLEGVRLLVGLDWRIYEYLTRSYERNNPAGYALYFISSAPVALVFGPTIGVPAILMLTLGDPISGLVGSDELRTVKRPAALGLMFVVSTAIAIPFVPPLAAVVGGIAATVADGLKPRIAGYVVDDNLTIAPVAALAMSLGLAV